MGTLIKAGSTGIHTPVHESTDNPKQPFTLVYDVCAESPDVVIVFHENENPDHVVRCSMKSVEFTQKILEDY